jgi:3-hydroxybutyryl-CoA dehydratase
MKKLAFKITEEEVEQYAVVSGDNNPIHLDIEAANQQGFSNKIVHGILTAAKVLRLVSNEILTVQEWVCQHE